jgi:hypothetical protein
MIIPTGIGCTLGGDAAFNPGVKLVAECCESLVVNPNAVNASDINEIPNNCYYTEGSILDSFLEGKFRLQKPKSFNKIVMVVNPPSIPENFNAMNAGIWGLGADIELLVLKTPLTMTARINPDGTADGDYSGIDELIAQVKEYDFDALAIHTKIKSDPETARYYWTHGGVNPWGGIEAKVSKLIASGINKPVAHAPVEGQIDNDLLNICSTKVVKLSTAPEIISKTFLFCVLKGLHRAPRIVMNGGIGKEDIDFLITPHGCWGRPHDACYKNGVPIIIVKENTTIFSNDFVYPDYNHLFFAENYLEASGIIMCMNAGVDFKTVLLEKK